MSQLHPADREALRRAGFTEREINTQQQKFRNLTQINPCYTDELRQFKRLQSDRRELLEALYNALPYVKDVLANKEQLACFKPGVVQAHAKAIRAAIDKAEAP